MSTTGRPSQAGSAIRLVLVGLGIAVVIALAVWLYVVDQALGEMDGLVFIG